LPALVGLGALLIDARFDKLPTDITALQFVAECLLCVLGKRRRVRGQAEKLCVRFLEVQVLEVGTIYFHGRFLLIAIISCGLGKQLANGN
jgi:hypothetical protein